MSLPESVREYRGQLLCFRPMYGWGWFRLGADGEKEPTDYAELDQAGDFHIRAHRFFSFHGELRGIVGRVEQNGHPFDGLWATTWTMLVGDYDLTQNLCSRWDSEFGQEEPGGPGEDDWPTEPKKTPAYFGTGGALAVSHEAIVAWQASFSSDGRSGPGASLGPGST
jgi:hypothetical protein